ncbi:MAG: hypothetical protein JSS14_22940 [Proteobacteria bacterium]|nr:hypothetical protein [Pseudomonadota bacterium]
MLDLAHLTIEEAHNKTLVLSVQARAAAAPRLGFGASAQPQAARAQLTLCLEDHDHLRECLLAYVEEMGRFELASPSLRDVYLDTVTRDLLEHAVEAGVCDQAGDTSAWLQPIGNVCLVMIADAARLAGVGAERLVEVAHEDALRQARANGKPHSTAALAIYEARAMAAKGESLR